MGPARRSEPFRRTSGAIRTRSPSLTHATHPLLPLFEMTLKNNNPIAVLPSDTHPPPQFL
eukprot:1242580-Rhodomonas_salina.1